MKHEKSKDWQTISEWIQDLEDGLITPHDRERLMDLMRQNRSVRELYLQHAELSALIHLNAESRNALGTMPISLDTLRREKRKSVILSLTYAVAAMLVLGIGLLISQVGRNFQSSPSWIVLEGSADATYAVVRGEEDSHSGKNLRPGDQITLERGLLKLGFPSGVEAIIEGGSQLELISNTTVRMDGGMGWFRVPENARGFTIRTQRGRVVDLGTEFGIRFDGRGDLEVHVAKGLVKVAPAMPGTANVELVGGTAMRFDSDGKGLSLEVKSSLFRRQFSKPIPYIHWSFDRLVDGSFPASGNLPGIEHYDARPRHLDNAEIQPADFLAEGFHGNAFSMNGEGLFAESAFPGIGGNAPRTVAAWVRHRGGDYDPRSTTEEISSLMAGHGVTTTGGTQAYLLNYTNAGLTTATGATGEILTAGVTYTLSFDVAALPENGRAGYQAQLVAFDPAENDSLREYCKPETGPGTVLAAANGQVTTSDMSAHDTIVFTPRADDPLLGKELGIRLLKTDGGVLYDNLRLVRNTPSGEKAVVWTENFESPVVTGFAINTIPVSGWVGATNGYGAKIRGLFSQRPLHSAPYCTWGGPEPGRHWALFMLSTRSLRWCAAHGDGLRHTPPTKWMTLDEWNHVATVHTGRFTDNGLPEILHFINGKPVKSGHTRPETNRNDDSRRSDIEIDTDILSDRAAPLHIGVLPGTRPGNPTLNGDIDELYIFRAALGEKEIGSLMEENPPAFYNNPPPSRK